MGTVIKESLKSSFASYTGLVLGIINVLFLYTKFLTPEELGLTRVLQDSTMLFVSFAQLGTPFIIIKFFPHFYDREKKNKGFLFFILVYSFIGFLIFTTLFIGLQSVYLKFYTTNSPLLVQYFLYIIPLVLGMTYINVLESYALVHSKVFFPTFIKEVFLKFGNTVVIILFALNIITFHVLINLLVLFYFLGAVLLTIYIWKLDALFVKADFKNFDFSKLRSMIGYGLFTLLGGLGFLLSTKIDTVMLPAYQGLKETAIYSIAILIATVMEIPKRNLTQAILPHLSFAIKDNDHAKIDDLYKKASLNLFIFGALIFIIVITNIDDIFRIIPKGDIFMAGKGVLIILLSGRLIDMISGVNNEIILYSKYYVYSFTLIMILAVCTIIANMIFIPMFGIIGAAIAVTLSGLIYMLLKLFIVWKKFDSHPFKANMISSLLLFGIILLLAAGLNLLLDNLVPIKDYSIKSKILSAVLILIKSSIVTTIFLFSFMKLKISDDFNSLIWGIFNKVKGFVK